MKIFHIKFSTPIKKVKNKLSKILHFYIEIEQKCEKFPSGSAPRTSHNFLQKYQSRSYNHGGLVGLENKLNLESPHTDTQTFQGAISLYFYATCETPRCAYREGKSSSRFIRNYRQYNVFDFPNFLKFPRLIFWLSSDFLHTY